MERGFSLVELESEFWLALHAFCACIQWALSQRGSIVGHIVKEDVKRHCFVT